MCYSTVKAEDMGYPNTKSNHNDTISKEGGIPGAYASVSNHVTYGEVAVNSLPIKYANVEGSLEHIKLELSQPNFTQLPN